MGSKDIKDIALKYLERREHSKFEVQIHLKEKGYSEEEISSVLDLLVDLNYIDDSRYCNSYIRYGISKGKGPNRLYHELKEKGICGELIKLYLDEQLDSDSEKENAMKQALKMIRSRDDYDVLLPKVARRLYALGYNSSVIYAVLEQIKLKVSNGN